MGAQQEMITFDEGIGRALEAAYATPENVRRRRMVMEAVQPGPSERGLDIGPGPGVFACELAQRVGPTGRVIAVDNAPSMLAMTQRRARQHGVADWMETHEGDAAALPLPDGAVDLAVASQVYEYVPAIEQALAEAYRVLRPGGRLAIVDTDFDTLVLHTDDTALTARVYRAMDEHFAHRTLPRRLPGLLRRAGFQLLAVEPVPVLNLEYNPSTYSFNVIGGLANFARGRAGVTSAEVDAWLADLERQNASGNYFFSVDQYLFRALKPAGGGS